MKKTTVTTDEISIITKYERMTFFCSFWDAISTLGPRNKLLAYEALLDYGLNKVRRHNLPNAVETIMIMAVPQIDASHRRYSEGMKGKKYGVLGAEHGQKGGRPKNDDRIVELNAVGEIDKNDLL